MRNRRLIFLVICVLGVVALIIVVGNDSIYNSKMGVNIPKSYEKDNDLMDSTGISMMLETNVEGVYEESTDTTWKSDNYVFNGELSACENGSELLWDNSNKTVRMIGDVSDNCYVYFDKKKDLSTLCNGKTLSECLTQVIYTGIDGENNIYKHDGEGPYRILEARNGVGVNSVYENSYRFSGASDDVNNYVCFGGDCDNTGTSENLYRIIGVFDNEVKLIKATEATTDLLGGFASNGVTKLGAYTGTENKYYWDRASGYNSVWGNSLLNTLNLNSGYTPGGSVTQTFGFLAKVGETWKEMINDHTWKVGGNTADNVTYNRGINNVYNYEILRSGLDEQYKVSPTEYTNKIGLMYVSDYMYAADPSDVNNAWSDLMGWNEDTITDFRSVKDKNWMSIDVSEWTITPGTEGLYVAYRIFLTGYAYPDGIYNTYNVRPCFYLKSNTPYIRGNGTAQDPFRIV